MSAILLRRGDGGWCGGFEARYFRLRLVENA